MPEPTVSLAPWAWQARRCGGVSAGHRESALGQLPLRRGSASTGGPAGRHGAEVLVHNTALEADDSHHGAPMVARCQVKIFFGALVGGPSPRSTPSCPGPPGKQARVPPWGGTHDLRRGSVHEMSVAHLNATDDQQVTPAECPGKAGKNPAVGHPREIFWVGLLDTKSNLRLHIAYK